MYAKETNDKLQYEYNSIMRSAEHRLVGCGIDVVRCQSWNLLPCLSLNRTHTDAIIIFSLSDEKYVEDYIEELAKIDFLVNLK